MDIRSFFRRLWRRTELAPVPPDQGLPAEMKPLIMGLTYTQAQELTCDEVYALLDVFAEMMSRHEDAAALMPLVQHHLEMCPDCREELDALLRSMAAATG